MFLSVLSFLLQSVYVTATVFLFNFFKTDTYRSTHHEKQDIMNVSNQEVTKYEPKIGTNKENRFMKAISEHRVTANYMSV